MTKRDWTPTATILHVSPSGHRQWSMGISLLVLLCSFAVDKTRSLGVPRSGHEKFQPGDPSFGMERKNTQRPDQPRLLLGCFQYGRFLAICGCCVNFAKFCTSRKSRRRWAEKHSKPGKDDLALSKTRFPIIKKMWEITLHLDGHTFAVLY